MTTDIIVSGAGPAGVVAARRAADLGARTTLITREEFGGSQRRNSDAWCLRTVLPSRGQLLETSAITRDTTRRIYKYYDLMMVSFVTVLLCSSLIGAGKVCQIGGYSFGAAIFFFPISYIFGDILTEVYGYARARRVIWAGFAAIGFASLMSWAVVAMPPAPGWPHQAAYITVYGQTPRIVAASLAAFWAGDFINSYVLAKLKLKTAGRFLWLRTIGSTVVGQGADSLIFYPLAFFGEWPAPLVLAVMTSNFFIKVGVEAVMTPVTYQVVGFLKRAEQEDYYDRGTDFNPFKIDTGTGKHLRIEETIDV